MTSWNRRSKRGFTLMELLVVIGVIALVATIALPAILGVFNAGADSQAYNLFAAQLTAARSVAIRNSTYSGVHVQMGKAWLSSGAEDTAGRGSCYSAIVTYCRNLKNFYGGIHACAIHNSGNWTSDYVPKRMPGTMVMGEISGTFIDASGNFQNLNSQPDIDNLTSFTVVFTPTGSLCRQVDGRNVFFDAGDSLFSGGYQKQLWDYTIANNSGSGEAGMAAVTMFDYRELDQRQDAATRAAYLNSAGQFIPINVHTGQPYPRE